MNSVYRIVGGLGSPYSMKMRAIFRYRRIPHIFQMRNGSVRQEVEHVRPSIIPMVLGPDDNDWMVDSTPIIYELEARHTDRSILPANPADRFIAELIEDFADEWLTKAMFHYRWFYAADQAYSSSWIAADQITGVEEPRKTRRAFATQITERQLSRMAIVGCTEQNQPVIEQSYERVLDVLEQHVGFGEFLFGTRPSIADFGLFGQLKTLGDDVTPQWIMRHRAPTLSHWVRQMDDLSGLRGEWRDSESNMPAVVSNLLQICGDTYLPFLAANTEALQNETDLSLTICDKPFSQPAFRYQAKCYERLKHLYAAVAPADREAVDELLNQTDCLRWLKS